MTYTARSSLFLLRSVCFNNFLLLTCGGRQPTTTANIEEEFRRQLQVTLAFVAYIRSCIVEDLSGLVQDLPVDNGYARHFAGRGHGPCLP